MIHWLVATWVPRNHLRKSDPDFIGLGKDNIMFTTGALVAIFVPLENLQQRLELLCRSTMFLGLFSD